MKYLLSFILFVVGAAVEVQAQATSVLRGVGPIAVEVQDIDPEAVRLGFTAEAIRTDIEVELRKAGIRVVGRDELDDASGKPYLHVVVNTLKGALNTFTYDMELSFRQNVSLTRNPDVTMSVPTWSRSVIGNERGNKLPVLREKIVEMLKPFINDYLAANPK